MFRSIWTRETALPEFPQLEGDHKTNVLIIGGGLCGLLCAYFFEQAGIDYILAEGSRIAGGATKNTTAKLTVQHGLIYDRLIRKLGPERAKMYLTANMDALEKYKELCTQGDCNFEEKSAFVYSVSHRRKIEAEAAAANRLGLDASFRESLNLPFKVAGAVEFPGQAQFDPIKFVTMISKGLNIYENTFIKGVTPHTAVYDRGMITADKMIAATHFPFINKHGSYFIKLYQRR